MVERLEALFPRLVQADWHVSSNADDCYNCIAWAASVTTAWWWPVGPGKTYWPATVARVVTLDAFREAFATLGYTVCETDDWEPGFEKVAIFADDRGVPRHAARQLPGGRWTSKLGKMEDIEHELHDLTGALYGSVALVLRRPLQQERTVKAVADPAG